MKTKTVYVCEVCGYESDEAASVTACEANGTLNPLPPVGAKVRLISFMSPSSVVYTVVEHGVWPGEFGIPHCSAFKTEPPCGDYDWGLGYEWWSGEWEIVA